MDSEYRLAAIDRRDFLRLGGAGLAGAALLGTAGGRVLAQTDSSPKVQFESAAREHEVPVELLLAMGYYNTLWEMPPPSTSAYRKGDPEGRGDYGIMQLTQNPSRKESQRSCPRKCARACCSWLGRRSPTPGATLQLGGCG